MRVQSPTTAREERLLALLRERGLAIDDPRLSSLVEDAQLAGSLALSGIEVTWDEVRRSRSGEDIRPEVAGWRRARAAVAPGEPVRTDTLLRWHGALLGPVGLRRTDREGSEAPAAPAALIEARLDTLAEWLGAPGLADLRPEQAAGLACARIVEVAPFDEGNGRVARLAASHLMVSRGQRPPVLVAADGPYLLACLRAAFRLDTEPLVSLLAEAAARATEVMIQALERGDP